MLIYKSDDDIEVCAATLYAEARGAERQECREWIAWVIRNRQKRKTEQFRNQKFSLKDICLEPFQFECWNDQECIEADYSGFKSCMNIVKSVMAQMSFEDPTEGCDHCNNVEKETKWVNGRQLPDYMDERPGYALFRCKKVQNHQFYKAKARVVWKDYHFEP